MPFTDSINIVNVVVTDRSLLNATPSDVAQGKQFIGSTQHVETGTVPVNNPISDMTLPAGSTLTVPYGINPKQFTITAQSIGSVTADADATDEDIILGKTAWVNGQKIVGTMPNIGAENDIILCDKAHTISRGYHDGNGVIRAESLMKQTPASIVAKDIIVGSTCWANGKKITGTMPVIKDNSVTRTLYAGDSYTIPEGYHSGRAVVSAASLASQTGGNAISETIIEGNTAWVNGQMITGTIKKIEPEKITLETNKTYYIPAGYHTGRGYVTQDVPNMDGQTVAPGKDAQTIECGGYYMNSDITISGVDALNYRFLNNDAVMNSSNEEITNYNLTVENNSASVKVNVDNWHDNATLNVYNLIFDNLIDSNGNRVNLNTTVVFNWKDQSTNVYTLGNITISTKYEENTNAHTIIIGGINSGILTMTEVFSARQFGVIKE